MSLPSISLATSFVNSSLDIENWSCVGKIFFRYFTLDTEVVWMSYFGIMKLSCCSASWHMFHLIVNVSAPFGKVRHVFV